MICKELMNNIKNDNISTFNIIYGDETYLIDSYVKQIIKKYVSDDMRELNYTKFESVSDNVNEIIENISTFPFMAEKKVIVIDECDFLSSNGTSVKSLEDKLLKIIDDKIETSIVLFIMKKKKPDTRKKLVKKIKDNKSLYEVKKLDEGELSNYIIQKFKENDTKITPLNASYIAENCGYIDYESTIDLYEVNNEIHKIATYALGQNEVTRDMIDELLTKSMDSNIFKLVDYICEGKKKDAFLMLDDMLVNGVAEQFIIHMIGRQVRMIYQYNVLLKKGYNSSQILDTMKIKPFIGKKLANLTKRISLDKTESLLQKLLEIDRSIKTGLLDKTVGLEMICDTF